MPARLTRVALTGGIATGKSYVLAQFAARGVPTIDADTLAREAVAPGTAGLAAVVTRFGPEVLDDQGALDRGLLGRMVFADTQARRDLEAIVHPVVRAAMDRWFTELPPRHRVAVADVPLLYETGRERAFDVVVATVCPPEVQVARLRARGLSDAEARQRLDAQLPAGEKAARATHVIRTDGTFAETDARVRAVLDALTHS
jgi:dephospho-CoA kinase